MGGRRSLNHQEHKEHEELLSLGRGPAAAGAAASGDGDGNSLKRQLHFVLFVSFVVKVVSLPPILMAYPNATIYQLSEEGMAAVKYTDTDYYSVTRDFLNRHERMLRVLMEE